ncbi:hypothetical protein BC937DRAFT_90120 [Endogone sp. FLAS-F59071]|nr:hypothetical protein BC937DRAFT_90120 [Endogone sp. FLAS-F59071]|eukprot:RUS22164.1 hypothetical protein BC937DRAFT_90120 [Endogone sp. FLAS-F59071]
MAGSKSHPSPLSASSASAVAAVTGAHDEEQRTRKRKHRSDEGLTEREAQDVKHEIFFPKFLTSKDLLKLEMADPYFRRHILVQFLIVLQYLLGFSSREREPPQAGKPGPAKPTHVLAEPQEVWVNEAHKRIMDELRLTPPDGRRFAETVLMVLKRDKNWIHWKAESCQSFEETPLGEDAYEDFPAKRRQLEAPHPAYRFKLGTHELTRLWTKANDVLPLAGVPGAGTPKLEDYIQNLTERPVAESLPEDEQREMHHARIWRALRIASAQHLHLFRELLDRVPLAENEGQTCERLALLVEQDRLGPTAKTGAANGEGKEKGEETEGKIEDGDGEGENENEVEAEAEAEAEGHNGGGGGGSDSGGVADLAGKTRRENGETKKENGEAMVIDVEAEAKTEAETRMRVGARTEGRADTRMRNDSEEEDDEVHLVRNGGGESEVETPSGV